MKKILTNGTVFKKFGRNNIINPDIRKIYFTEDLKYLTWINQSEKVDLSKKPVKKISIDKDFLFKIVEGRKTKNFKRFKNENENLSFSIMIDYRTIDLEAQNQEDKIIFLKAFEYLKKY